MSNWNYMNTAPKDGTRVLLTNGEIISIGAWERQWSYSHGWTCEAEPQATDGPGAIAGYWRGPPIRWTQLPELPNG